MHSLPLLNQEKTKLIDKIFQIYANKINNKMKWLTKMLVKIHNTETSLKVRTSSSNRPSWINKARWSS